MSKRRLKDIAEDFDISFEKAQDLATNNLEEEMVSGRGKNTWISLEGQKMFDDLIPMPILYRGRVLCLAPNKRFAFVFIKELTKKVPVKIPPRYIKNVVGKFICVQADNKGLEPKYFWVRN
tara:strand:+ start:2446 stop:2808 length:363 start_codon:yes stop_codon:yes gene_type:complete